MTPLLVVGAVIFVCAIVFILLLGASFVAALVFHFVPTLQGSILVLTMSDITRKLRQMPTYPTWCRWRGNRFRKKVLVMLAVDHVNGPEYLSTFDPLHRTVFTSNSRDGMRLDLGDRYLLERLVRRAEDEGLKVFLVPVDPSTSREVRRELLRWPRVYWDRLRPPADIPVGLYKRIPGGPHPGHALIARASQPGWSLASPRKKSGERILLSR